MKKVILIMLILIPCIGFAQVVVVEEPVKAEPVYDVKEDLVTVEKTKTEEVVTTITLDEISAQINKYYADIASNEAQIVYFQDLIAKLEAEYVYLKSLGVLTSEEKEGGGK